MGSNLDVKRLTRWLNGELGDAEELVVRHLDGGASNEVFEIDRGADRFILRHPPTTSAHASAHDVMREYRFICALEGSVARVPKPVIACADPSVLGVPFYLMERIDGVPIREVLPPHYRGRADHHARIGEELIDALAEIHSVEYRSVALDDMGKPEGYLARQPARWKKQLESYRVRELPYFDQIGAWLASNTPTSPAPSIVHGDYKTDNALYSRDLPPRILAIVDWELATIGDPLVDLAWALFFWPESTPHASTLGSPGTPEGFILDNLPSVADLAARYARKSGRDISALRYYSVLTGYKLAVILEGNYARYSKGQSNHPMHAGFESMVPEILGRAFAACQEGPL